MTREEILKDPGYLRLTEQQKTFVLAMIDNGGDKVEAAFSAYKCKDRYSAVTMASKCYRNLIISRLVDAYYGEKASDRVPSSDELAAAAWDRAIASEDENAAHKWFALVARVLKYDKIEDPAVKEQERRTAAEGDKLIAELEARGLVNAKQPSSK